jgi:hypothetical protein
LQKTLVVADEQLLHGLAVPMVAEHTGKLYLSTHRLLLQAAAAAFGRGGNDGEGRRRVTSTLCFQGSKHAALAAQQFPQPAPKASTKGAIHKEVGSTVDHLLVGCFFGKDFDFTYYDHY